MIPHPFSEETISLRHVVEFRLCPDSLSGIHTVKIKRPIYTAEPIYSYVSGKNAGHNQVSVSKNDHL